MIVLTRIDNRLIHGQVIEAWLPYLGIKRLVVVDDAAAADPLTRAAIGLAVPQGIEVRLLPMGGADFAALQRDAVRTLVLVREVAHAVTARERGLPSGPLNVGNVHAGPARAAISRSVFLSEAERQQLLGLAASGMTISVQAVPTDVPVSVPTERPPMQSRGATH